MAATPEGMQRDLTGRQFKEIGTLLKYFPAFATEPQGT